MVTKLTPPTMEFGIDLHGISNLLRLISSRPNERTAPNEHDLKGDFDIWFDGGAARIVTGYNHYTLMDGIEVWYWHAEGFRQEGIITVRYPDGTKITVKEQAP